MVAKPPRYTIKNFDHFVRLLIGRWEDAVEMQSKWLSMDQEERAFETEDWPVNNDIHQDLADYVSEHDLTEDQKAQWARLNELVAEYTETLREMGYGVILPKGPKRREREVA